jgi:recombination protein RecT
VPPRGNAPARQQQQQQQQSAATVVRPQGQQADPGAPSRALVAVTHEIDQRLALVRASAAAGISPDRLKLVALTVFTRTPSLMTCTPVSIARAIVEAGQLGLEPTGLLGGAYLVPRGGQATLLVGYKGLVILAMRSGLVRRVEARVVREKDVFEYEYGLEPRLVHKPSVDLNPGPYTAAYAVLFFRDGSTQFDVMSIAEIEAIRTRSSSPNAGPWVTDYAEMCKKTPLRRLMKLAPLTVEVAAKLDELDPETEDHGTVAITGREAELRQQLQAALEREYGTAPALLGAGAATTTQGGGAGEPAAQAPGAEGAVAAPSAPGVAQQAAAGSGPPPPAAPAAPAPAAGATCGAAWEAMGAGPCVLPAGHDTGPWKDATGADQKPQASHQQADGNMFTTPNGGK